MQKGDENKLGTRNSVSTKQTQQTHNLYIKTSLKSLLALQKYFEKSLSPSVQIVINFFKLYSYLKFYLSALYTKNRGKIKKWLKSEIMA